MLLFKRVDSLMELFSDDAVFDESVVGAGPFSGSGAIRQHMELSMPLMASMLHCTSNVLVEFVDARNAKGTSTLLCESVKVSGVVNRLQGFFTDSYTKVGEQWKFRSRKLSLLAPLAEGRLGP